MTQVDQILTRLRHIQFSIKFDIGKSAWPIEYFKGFLVIISQKIFFTLKIDFVFANSGDPVEMPPSAAFNLGIYCLL